MLLIDCSRNTGFFGDSTNCPWNCPPLFCCAIEMTNLKLTQKPALSHRMSHGRRGVPLQQERQRVRPLQALRDDRHDEGRQDLLPDPVRRPDLQGCTARFNHWNSSTVQPWWYVPLPYKAIRRTSWFHVISDSFSVTKYVMCSSRKWRTNRWNVISRHVLSRLHCILYSVWKMV